MYATANTVTLHALLVMLLLYFNSCRVCKQLLKFAKLSWHPLKLLCWR
jgi:hypothetical protein